MTRRTRLVTGITCAILAVLVLLWLLFAHASAPARTAITWKMQPDRFPLGSVLQGSRVEMSLGLLSGVKPKPMPAFVTALSPPLRKGAEWGVEKFRDAAVKMGLRVRVDAPAFVEVERTQVTIHPSQGPFVVV